MVGFIAAEEGGEKNVGVDKVLEKGKLEEAIQRCAWDVEAMEAIDNED